MNRADLLAETPQARQERHRAEHERREHRKHLEDVERRLTGLRQARDQAVREHAARLRNEHFTAVRALRNAEERAARVGPVRRVLVPALVGVPAEARAAAAAVEEARAVVALIEAEIVRELDREARRPAA